LLGFGLKTLRTKRDVLIALAIRAGSVLAGFAVTFLIGNRFGPAGNGQFALVTQTAIFFAVVGLLGLDVSVVRHFAKAVATKTRIQLLALLQVTGLGLGLMVAISLALWLGGEWIWSSLFGDAVPREMLLVMCILLVSRGGTTLFGGLLRSQHRFALGQFIASLTIPMVTATALITGFADSLNSALWATAFAGVGSILIGALAMSRHVGRGPEALAIPLRPVLASALPLWGVGIAMHIGDWYGLAVAAQMLSAADAGLYRVAVQLAATLQIVSIALFSVYSAKISTAFHAGNTRQVALLARSAVRMSTAASLPMVLALLVGSEFILNQIGPEFAPALPIVYILIAGQVAQTVTGPCGLVLAMSGNEKINLAITLTSTALLLLCVPAAAYFAGLPGIAICVSALMLLRNLLAYTVVRRKLGISIWAGTVRGIDKEPIA
jgi:O-antigen/teichoic acid export membrane protein